LRLHFSFHWLLRALAVSSLLATVIPSASLAQQPPQKPAEKPIAKSSIPAEPKNPAQIELLETRYRFEANGDSRQGSPHSRAHQQRTRCPTIRPLISTTTLFESVEIPLSTLRIPAAAPPTFSQRHHDQPIPRSFNAPAYQDVRRQVGPHPRSPPATTSNNRVITTTTRHPSLPILALTRLRSRRNRLTTIIRDRSARVARPLGLLLPWQHTITKPYGPEKGLNKAHLPVEAPSKCSGFFPKSHGRFFDLPIVSVESILFSHV